MSNPSLSAERLTDESWINRSVAGIVGGLAGGLVMGVLLQVGTDLVPVFGRILGAESALLGWIVHLFTSVVFGLLFAAFVSLPIVEELERTVSTSVLLAVIHASALSYVTIGVLLPAATIALGIPDLALFSQLVEGPGMAGLVPAGVFSLGHVTYGVVLGAVYAILEDLERE